MPYGLETLGVQAHVVIPHGKFLVSLTGRAHQPVALRAVLREAFLQVENELPRIVHGIFHHVFHEDHVFVQNPFGLVQVDGRNITDYNSRQLTAYRRDDIGFVFQFYNLVPNLTALENVELAMQICKNPLDAKEVLREVGLEKRMGNFPAQLSGGEQQRVSIARALAKNPKLLLCDEPTGALDYQTGKAILKLLQDMCREKNMTVIVITHNSALTPMADRVIHIKNGTVSSMEQNDHPTPVEEIEW